MINFNPDWAANMDGARFIAVRVPQIQAKLYADDLLDDVVGIGGCIDQTLAVACQESTDEYDLADKLTYIINQLYQARANITKDLS